MTREGNIVRLPEPDDLRMEAASWVTVLGREHVSEKDVAQFKAWLRESDRHKEAFDSLSALAGELPILKELDDVAEATVTAFPPETRYMPRRAMMAMAASLAAVVVAGGAYYAYTATRPYHVEYATAVGEQQTYTLADGSILELNTNSRAVIDFSRDARTVRLAQGEAHFKVAKNPDRPFSVYAGEGVVTAVGTAFTVRVKEDKALDVTVEEGRVALAKQAPTTRPTKTPKPPTPLAQLDAGQTTIFADKVNAIEEIPEKELKRKLLWRDGLLNYGGEPLTAVIADVSRYTDIKIEIADPALEERRVAGFFRIDDIEGSLDSLAMSFGLDVEHVDAKHIRLVDAS